MNNLPKKETPGVDAQGVDKTIAVTGCENVSTAGKGQDGLGSIIKYPRPESSVSALDSDPRIVTPEILSAGLLQADQMGALEITPRDSVCGTWFKVGDLGFVFGPRGLGKTWFTMNLARSIGEGRPIGPWPVPESRKVLYIDGEMPLDTIRDRNASLGTGDAKLCFLNHEWLFQKTGSVLNLTDRIAQTAVLKLCRDQGAEVLILDNLSCLFSGMAENDADAWEKVLPWLLTLRRANIACILVHHSGRAGTHMRGTTRREDAAFWVIRLDEDPDPAHISNGARFISRFTKNRQGSRDETEPLNWSYCTHDGITEVEFRQLPNIEVFRQWVRDGLDRCSEIAEEMGISKGMVSRMAKIGESDGWLRISRRVYSLIEGVR